MPVNPEDLKIPELFYSEASGKPFDTCIDCNKDLLRGNQEYVIEKAFKKYPDYNANDTIFEYAICIECAEQLFMSFSESSRKAIEEYFKQHVDIENQLKNLSKIDTFNLDDHLNKCMVKGVTIENLQEYQMVCYCRGNQISIFRPPYMISGEAADEVMQLLSNATIDVLNRFTDEFLGLPPEFKDLFKDKPMLVF
ncbi:MAG: hypothetical protein JW956_05895 [Calditrichaceae bacterium]|nr:hypothetical protein [Calditrichaceae bacterium]